MTPVEIFEYKNKWKPQACRVRVDVDSDVWSKDWCRKNLERQEWSFDRYHYPDDSHVVFFHHRPDAVRFTEAYNQYRGKDVGRIEGSSSQ